MEYIFQSIKSPIYRESEFSNIRYILEIDNAFSPDFNTIQVYFDSIIPAFSRYNNMFTEASIYFVLPKQIRKFKYQSLRPEIKTANYFFYGEVYHGNEDLKLTVKEFHKKQEMAANLRDYIFLFDHPKHSLRKTFT
jgi:hypothetical protein